MYRTFKNSIVMLAVVLGAGQIASARHHHRDNDATPGEFDYYLLSMSWSPAFCMQQPSAEECNGPRRFGFIVHGLWPQNERGWPEHCAEGADVSDATVDAIADLMPARKLVHHEWSTHGTCSGLAPDAFFALVRRAYGSVAIPAIFKNPSAGIEQTPGTIVNAFMRSNPLLAANSVVATCSGQEVARLREVHVCFDRDLNPRACSADVLREACRAESVIVPPVR